VAFLPQNNTSKNEAFFAKINFFNVFQTDTNMAKTGMLCALVSAQVQNIINNFWKQRLMVFQNKTLGNNDAH